jgi:uncharacterized protein (TIGR02231 family)
LIYSIGNGRGAACGSLGSSWSIQMRTPLINASVALALIGSSCGTTAQESARRELSASGVVRAVTLFRDAARVTRYITIDGDPGEWTVVVTGLPMSLKRGSVRTDPRGSVEVLNVVETTDGALRGTTADVALKSKRARLADEVGSNRSAVRAYAQQANYLAKLESFVATATLEDTARGTLEVEAVRELSLFVFEQQIRIGTEIDRLTRESRDLISREAVLKAQEAKARAVAASPVVKLQLKKLHAGRTKLAVSYLIPGPNWKPDYGLELITGKPHATLVSRARVSQHTGEDWSGVRMTLSTEGANSDAQGAPLAPLAVTLRKIPKSEPDILLERLDRNELQLAELELPEGFKFPATEGDSISDSVARITVDGQVDVLSAAGAQLVQLSRRQVPGDVYLVATPLTDSVTHRRASISNNTRRTLLPGRMDIFLDGRFLAKSSVPSVRARQSFTAELGAEPAFSVARRRNSRTVATQGNQRRIMVGYALELINNTGTMQNLRLFERHPVATERGLIEVHLDDATPPLSTDEAYLRTDAKKGILRWDLTVPPHDNGDAASFSYGYSLGIDRGFRLVVDSAGE